MTITNVTHITNFDQKVYDGLIADAKAQGMQARQVDTLLLQAVNTGNKSFSDAVQAVRQDLPALSPPRHTEFSRIAEFGLVPSPGSLVTALLIKNAAEQREQNAKVRQTEVDAVAKSMKQEAKMMKDMAVAQLVLGIASGVVSIAAGVVQFGGSVKALSMQPQQVTGGCPRSDGPTAPICCPWSDRCRLQKSFAEGASKNLLGSQLMTANTATQGMSQSISGAGTILNAYSQFVGTSGQSSFKSMEADQEQMRATREKTDSLDKALQELIQKLLAALDSVQQGQNQARTRILG